MSEVPPELIAALQHQRDHREVEIHSDTSWLEGLKLDQLQHLEQVIRTATQTPAYGQYMLGRIDGVLQYVHQVCACGKKHETIDSILGDDDANEAADMAETVEHLATAAETMPDLTQGGLGNEKMAEAMNAVRPLTRDEIVRDMEVYGLEDHVTKTGRKQLRCKNCYQPYPSVADRMLREPGINGCPGCQEYSAHGARFPDE